MKNPQFYWGVPFFIVKQKQGITSILDIIPRKTILILLILLPVYPYPRQQYHKSHQVSNNTQAPSMAH